MKKTIIAFLAAILLIGSAWAADVKLVAMRSKFIEASGQIKSSLASSKDVVVLTSLFDSCMITITELDAYFSMVGIFEQNKTGAPSNVSLAYLTSWLETMKKNNALNISSIQGLTKDMEPGTLTHMNKLKTYFGELNVNLEDELRRVNALKKGAVSQASAVKPAAAKSTGRK